MSKIKSHINSLFYLIVIIVASKDSFAEMPSWYVNYEFKRVKLAVSARSKIIDLLEKDDYDSIGLVINYCDSILTEPDYWLMRDERFLIKILSGNGSILKAKATYINHFRLSETERDPRLNNFMVCGTYLFSLISSRNPLGIPSENLHRVLKAKFNVKFAHFMHEFSEEMYIWDFATIAFANILSLREATDSLAREYMKKYPDSEFYPLVKYNYIKKTTYANTGFCWGFTFGYKHFGKKTRQLFPDRLNRELFIEGMLKSITLTINSNISMTPIRDYLVIDNDTLPPRTLINMRSFDFTTGYAIKLSNAINVIPYIGIATFISYLPSHYEKELHVDPHLPTYIGLKSGTTVHWRFLPNRSNTHSLAFRFDIGCYNGKYDRYDPEFEPFLFYLKFGIEWMTFKRAWDYSLN